jgi:hypothetical protein
MGAINKTATQQQLQKTELERAKAETNRKTAEENRALADKAYMNKLELSPNLFVQLEGIKARLAAVKIMAEQSKNVTFVYSGEGQPMTLPIQQQK